jgi:hypothetical protein
MRSTVGAAILSADGSRTRPTAAEKGEAVTASDPDRHLPFRLPSQARLASQSPSARTANEAEQPAPVV